MVALLALITALITAGTMMQMRRESKERIRAAALAAREGEMEQVGQSAGQSAGVDASSLLRASEPPLPPPGAVEGFVNHWSLLRNSRSFLKVREGEKNPYACMDFFRVFSMAQVVLGHSFVYSMSSVGYANMEQFTPPYGLVSTAGFQIVPGCFYGVDSFFVLSGFFCAMGLESKMFNRPGSKTPLGFSLKYFQFVLFRYLRLVPTEMYCIGLSMFILPHA